MHVRRRNVDVSPVRIRNAIQACRTLVECISLANILSDMCRLHYGLISTYFYNDAGTFQISKNPKCVLVSQFQCISGKGPLIRVRGDEVSNKCRNLY